MWLLGSEESPKYLPEQGPIRVPQPREEVVQRWTQEEGTVRLLPEEVRESVGVVIKDLYADSEVEQHVVGEGDAGAGVVRVLEHL